MDPRRIEYLTATEAGALMRSGDLSPSSLLETLLARIDALEPTVKAWVTIDRDGALNLAREMTAEAGAGFYRGPLHGIPAGIKDIFHVEGMLTTAGAAAFAHVQAAQDAPSIARLRRSGAIILGKTTTTEFAYLDATITTNPWNPEHTPGGSSAGSAAAVTAGMIPLALGSQTIGSTLRPAAYCGIVGFKPTHGRIDIDGVHPLAPSLDHVGIFCRSVADAVLVFTVLSGRSAPASGASPGVVRAPRIGVIHEYFSSRADPATQANLGDIVKTMARAGAQVTEVPLPASFEEVHAATSLIVEVEAAAVHRERFEDHGPHYGPKMRAALERGLQRSAEAYAQALDVRRRFRGDMARVTGQVDALLMPTTPSPAPHGLEATGDPSFCAPWSFAGFPAISLPSGLTPYRLPLGIQLVAGPQADLALLAVAQWCEPVIGFEASPDRDGRLASVPRSV